MNENECEADPCHADADCTDTAGGFVCRCRDGYEGSGVQCQGVCSLVGSSFIAHCACKTIEIYGCDDIVQTELIQLGHYHLMITGRLSLLTLTSKSCLLCVLAAPILQQCRDNL